MIDVIWAPVCGTLGKDQLHTVKELRNLRFAYGNLAIFSHPNPCINSLSAG